jgi:hypothetical protein
MLVVMFVMVFMVVVVLLSVRLSCGSNREK